MENTISSFVVLFQNIVSWVIGFLIFYSKLLCFFPSQIQSIWAKTNSNEKAMKNVPTQKLQLNEEKDDVATLSWDETKMVMGKTGIFCGPDDVKEKIVEWLGGKEFSALFEEEEPSLEEAKEAFKVFDAKKDGFIDAEELQRVLCNLGFREAMELEACKRMIGAFDKKNKEKIDFKEFIKLLENSFG